MYDPTVQFPISYLSKLLKRLVARQLLAHLNSSGLLPRFQSAHRAHHSTETAVLKVLTDILLAVDACRRFVCMPLFCWTYWRPSIQSIMIFFCIDWTFPIRSWDQYNIGFNPTCQTGYNTCESDLPLHHPAPWCVVYPMVPSLAPYFAFCTVATCSWSLRSTDSARICILMTHRSTVPVVYEHTRSFKHASQRALAMSLSGCVQIASRFQLNAATTEILWYAASRRLVDLGIHDLAYRNSSRLRHVDEFSRQEDTCQCVAVLRQLRSIRRCPPYLADELSRPADSQARCRLRSASSSIAYYMYGRPSNSPYN